MWKQLQPADKIIDLTLEEDEVKQEEAADTEAFPAAEGPDSGQKMSAKRRITGKKAAMKPRGAETLKTAVLKPEKAETLKTVVLKPEKAEALKTAVMKPEKVERRGGMLYGHKWAPHEGHGLCRGADGPCVLGCNGSPAPAGPSGFCDLCNLDDLEVLHLHGGGRLTHLLLQLSEPEAGLALRRIEEKDRDIAESLRQRVQRARHRRGGNRTKRGPRGPYKKKG